MPGAISIATAKAGLAAFARSIAKEYGSYGITANVVSPGIVETELSSRIPAEQKQRMGSMTPLGRIAQPEDIARAIAFFASNDSGFITGTSMPVNGGMSPFPFVRRETRVQRPMLQVHVPGCVQPVPRVVGLPGPAGSVR
jgi:NAD(P)-dependent dehydrogenase (short-subunit alcohol dehydrogenase family)